MEGRYHGHGRSGIDVGADHRSSDNLAHLSIDPSTNDLIIIISSSTLNPHLSHLTASASTEAHVRLRPDDVAAGATPPRSDRTTTLPTTRRSPGDL